jgi:hypothetical protein
MILFKNSSIPVQYYLAIKKLIIEHHIKSLLAKKNFLIIVAEEHGNPITMLAKELITHAASPIIKDLFVELDKRTINNIKSREEYRELLFKEIAVYMSDAEDIGLNVTPADEMRGGYPYPEGHKLEALPPMVTVDDETLKLRNKEMARQIHLFNRNALLNIGSDHLEGLMNEIDCEEFYVFAINISTTPDDGYYFYADTNFALQCVPNKQFKASICMENGFDEVASAAKFIVNLAKQQESQRIAFFHTQFESHNPDLQSQLGIRF